MAYKRAFDGTVTQAPHRNAGLSRHQTTNAARVAHENRRLRVPVDAVELFHHHHVGRDCEQDVAHPVEEHRKPSLETLSFARLHESRFDQARALSPRARFDGAVARAHQPRIDAQDDHCEVDCAGPATNRFTLWPGASWLSCAGSERTTTPGGPCET